MDLTFRENYWNARKLKKAFMDYLVQVFGLDLSLWDKMGFWDQRYRPFSYFNDDSLVSNVCVYSMDMTVQGRRCRVAQLSAVGTLPDYRRKGLSRTLIRAAMDWANDTHEFFFLFADEGAYQFYEDCGFRRVDEYKVRISFSGMTARSGVIKMDMHKPDHIDRVYRIASQREPVSDILGVSNAKLLIYWCLYGLRDYVYYIPELDTLVLCKRTGGLLTVFDIVGSTVPVFADLYPYICDPGDETVEFLFMVDKLNLGNVGYVRIDENGAHVYGRFPLESGKFIFPLTSQA